MTAVWLFLTRWGVVALGAILAFWGAAAMWEGWGIIQLERGWSLFIAGAVAASGGAIVLALGVVLSRLDRLIRAVAERSAAPVEVDRYANGDATYVMFSDGSVELHDGGRARRFASVSHLRAQVGA